MICCNKEMVDLGNGNYSCSVCGRILNDLVYREYKSPSDGKENGTCEDAWQNYYLEPTRNPTFISIPRSKMMYRCESGIIHKSQKNTIRANLIANFVGDNRADNHFDCKFIYHSIADWEAWNLVDNFRKPSGKYRYNGNQYTFDELCNLLQEEFIRVELVAKIIEESERDDL